MKAVPLRACEEPLNKDEIKDKIAIIERGDCMFIEKVRYFFLSHCFDKISLKKTFFSFRQELCPTVCVVFYSL